MKRRTGHTPQLLVVDDDEDFLVVTARALEDAGFDVTGVSTGDEALRVIRERTFDLVLLDVEMFGTGGFDVLRSIRKESPTTDCIMITGNRDVNLAVEALKAGAKEFLNKPIRVDELVHCMKATLRAHVAEQQVRELQAEFTSKILHNLLTPLHSIKSAIVFLQKETAGPLTDQQRTVLHTVDTTVQSMDVLLNNMIDLSLFESGRIDLEKIPTNLDELVPAICAKFKAQANAKRIALTVDVSKDVPTLELDPSRIEQVISNLLSNAIAFTPDGGTIRVCASETTNGVDVAVIDSGIGIAADEFPHLFDKYKQLLSGSDDVEKKTSLGLAICKSIIEAHGGTISAESEVGKGSTFRFRLPVAG